MTTLKFANTHNMVAFLSKPTESDAKTINREVQLHAQVDGKEIVITKLSVKRDLQLAYEECIDCLPNSIIFEQLALMGKPKRKNTQVPQPSGPTESVADEAVHKELGDSLVRAVTTASSLEAECQETIEDTIAQTRVLDLEKTKTTQRNEIDSLKRRVKKLEKRNTGRRIDAIDSGEDITLVNDADFEMFDVDDLGGYKLKDLKLKEFHRIQGMFEKAFKRVNTFEDFRTELVEGKEKRAGTELEQEITRKQKVEDDKEKAELKQLMETILDEVEVAIDVIPLAVKSIRIVY
uniref:Uncharacterized protein n=1 Tax=Tanacetum cinerariifolium TaxID=118510 RepID=A0A6L2NQ91_TANCI|nr:hypothetical protein [Tanacetum cinerariifolium]